MNTNWMPENPYREQHKNRTPANGWDLCLQLGAFDEGSREAAKSTLKEVIRICKNHEYQNIPSDIKYFKEMLKQLEAK